MNVAEFLKQQVRVFKDFSGERLRQLVDGSRDVSFEANEAIVHCGAEATHFCIVLSGTVVASIPGDGGARQVLGQLKAGDTFGELALMTDMSTEFYMQCSPTKGVWQLYIEGVSV